MSEAETPAADWYAQRNVDMQAAEILLASDAPLSAVAFHIQQAVEKYLKGLLISTGWPLRRTHDLELLAQEAIAHDADFSPFLAPCQRITEYYIESRYPLGIHTLLGRETIESDLEIAHDLIELIHWNTAQPGASPGPG